MPDNLFLTFPVAETRYQSAPSLYCMGNSRLGKFFIEGEDKLTKEMMKFAQQSGSFDFLLNPVEDIYTLDDGEEI